MRKMIIAAVAAGLMTVAAPAFADNTPAGTSEGHEEPVYDADGNQTGTTHVEDNQISCGGAEDKTIDTGTGISVNAAGDPAEGGALVVCNEGGNEAPVQGRVIASGGTSGGSVAADGDADNEAEQAQGWARVNVDGDGPAIGCGNTETGDTDSADPAGPLSTDTCG